MGGGGVVQLSFNLRRFYMYNWQNIGMSTAFFFFFSKCQLWGKKRTTREAEEAFFNEYLISHTTILSNYEKIKMLMLKKSHSCDTFI